MRDAFVFYSSFLIALKNLEDAERLMAYDAICNYAITGEEPVIDGITAAIFSLVKPQIDANARKYDKNRENGKKGGRPKKAKSEVGIENKNPTETQLKPKKTLKEKYKYKEKEKYKYGSLQNVFLTTEEYDRLIEKYGQDKADKAIEYLSKYIVEKEYKTKSHYLTITRWVIDAVSKTARSGTNQFTGFTQRSDYDMATIEKMLEG